MRMALNFIHHMGLFLLFSTNTMIRETSLSSLLSNININIYSGVHIWMRVEANKGLNSAACGVRPLAMQFRCSAIEMFAEPFKSVTIHHIQLKYKFMQMGKCVFHLKINFIVMRVGWVPNREGTTSPFYEPQINEAFLCSNNYLINM